MKALLSAVAICVFVILPAHHARATPTDIVVRVLAKDAKFIGTETGGADVTLRDAKTGRILGHGLTAGSTGNTQKIMTDARLRRSTSSDDASAKVSFTLDIDRPTLITVTATGPKNSEQRALSASTQQWVLPGKPITEGDALLLELPGFVIDLTEPVPPSVKLNGPQKIPLHVKITMQCGCPITPGGLWDANKIEVGAILRRRGKMVTQSLLTYSGKPSSFAGDIELSERGDYTIELFAYAPWDGNADVREIAVHAR